MQSEAVAAQARAQESLHFNMQISQALLDKASAAAANLQTMMDETASRYRESPVLGGLWGSISPWTVSAFLFSVIGSQSPRIAVAVLMVAGSK